MPSRHTKTMLTAFAVLLGSAIVALGMGIRQFSEDFERPDPNWFFTGNAGFDNGKGLAHRGQGNAWVRSKSGWNAVNRWMEVERNSDCSVTAWLRLSPDLTDGYIAVRNEKKNPAVGNFEVIKEIKLVGPGPRNSRNADYNSYTFDFYSEKNVRVLFYVGLHGNGRDSWIQIDDVAVSSRPVIPNY